MKLSDLKEYDYDAYEKACMNVHVQEGLDYLLKAIKEDKPLWVCFYFRKSEEGFKYWDDLTKSYREYCIEKEKSNKKIVISLDQWEANILNVALDHMADHLRDVVSDKDDNHICDVEDYRNRLIWVEDMIKILSE